METRLPVGMPGWDLIVRDRQERLRAEAQAERLARDPQPARLPFGRWTNRRRVVARPVCAGTTEGTC